MLLNEFSLQDNSSSLLHYLVHKYVTEFEKADSPDSDTPVTMEIKSQLPVPEPSDITQASLVNFDDIEQELKKIATSVEGMFELRCNA